MKEKRNKRLRNLCIWGSILIIWFIIMIVLSSQNGATTEITGNGFAYILKDAFHLEAPVYVIHLKARRVAHIFLYFVFAILLKKCMQSLVSWKPVPFYLILTVVGFLVAYFDELHKKFIPGRHYSINDVMLNFIGYVTALVLLCGIDLLRKWRLKSSGLEDYNADKK